jgi:hypothetical protein
MTFLLFAVVIGIGATFLLDVWTVLLRVAFNVRSLNYCLLGRWLQHLPRTFSHANIAASRAKPRECAVGWTAHYLIGAAFAVAFVALVSTAWLQHPTLVPALAFGIATVVFPYYIRQPAMGLGIASAKAAHPLVARLKSLSVHAVFGAGLWLSAALLTGVTK